MKNGMLILGVAAGIGLLAFGASASEAANHKGEPVEEGQRVRVIYGMSRLNQDQARALLNFVVSWGDMVDEPVFSNGEVAIVADVFTDQPNGIPDIPGPTELGDLFVSKVEFL